MSVIIAISNQKGGVAKTTTTHNLGVALAKKNKKVLLVDLDSQASLTISVGIEPLDIENNIYSILSKNGKKVEDCIQKISDNIDIITSIIDLAQLEMEMISRTSKEKILDRALYSIKEKYDYIIIDCPPQLSILTINALSCADRVIIPVKTDYLAYRGVTQLKETIEEIKELINNKLEIYGVIATMYEMNISDDRMLLEYLRKDYDVVGVVKKLSAAKKGIADGLSVVEHSPNSEISVEYLRVADEMIKKLEGAN